MIIPESLIVIERAGGHGKCENCGAEVPRLGKCSDGRAICCVACVFNPHGCQCKLGNYGVPDAPRFDCDEGEADEIDDLDEWEEAASECGQDESGACSLAGSEFCEFDCPFNS